MICADEYCSRFLYIRNTDSFHKKTLRGGPGLGSETQAYRKRQEMEWGRFNILQIYPTTFGEFPRPDVSVRWTPPGKPSLRYQLLYRGVYEYLREPPAQRYVPQAVRYLRQLKKCYHPSNTLQRDRILWTRAWLDAVEDPSDSDDETVFGGDE